jgi:hypothetical protein
MNAAPEYLTGSGWVNRPGDAAPALAREVTCVRSSMTMLT